MSQIKSCFISRYPKGKLVQFDYSQLEIICLAYLSQDKELMADLRSGIDMHCRMASFMTGYSYEEIKAKVSRGDVVWIQKRKDAKALGFLVQYGGSAKLMSKNTGLDVAVCKAFIKGYYDRYGGVKEWQKRVANRVLFGRKPSKHMTPSGTQLAQSSINSVTERRYTFIEQIAPEWSSKSTSFSPTQMKNFPVQGLATGDIVPMMLGRWNRWLYTNYPDKVKLINTTHDSGMLDVDWYHMNGSNWSGLIEGSRELLESAPTVFKEVFGIEFNMPLKVDVEYGNDWGNLKVFPRT